MNPKDESEYPPEWPLALTFELACEWDEEAMEKLEIILGLRNE